MAEQDVHDEPLQHTDEVGIYDAEWIVKAYKERWVMPSRFVAEEHYVSALDRIATLTAMIAAAKEALDA